MAKLYFRYGTVNSSKTMNLLAVAHAYRQQQKRVVLVKPSLDTRFGATQIRSRAGMEATADLLVDPESPLPRSSFVGASCVLVDEAQFLSERLVEELRALTVDLEIPVICYGLRTDYKGRLFPGSKRLMELADAIEEVKTTCLHCNRKAVMSLKHAASSSDDVIDLGGEEKYSPVCYQCYTKYHSSAATVNHTAKQPALEEAA